MKRVFLSFLIAILPMLCMAGDWVKVGSTDTETNYIYTDIQNDEFGNRLVWQKTTYDTENARKQAMKSYHTKYYVFEIKVLMAYDPQWNKGALRTLTAYGRKGNTLSSYSFPYDDWQYIVPESVGEAIRDAAKYFYGQ